MKTALDVLINRIKVAVKDLQHYSFSEFQKILPEHIHRNISYGLLDSLFSKETGISIKTYFNHAKFEKANELFNHYHLNPKEVAFQLGYKSPTSLIHSIKKQPGLKRSHGRFARSGIKTTLPEFSL
jgi:YesN/AraC family two-component response regulator